MILKPFGKIIAQIQRFLLVYASHEPDIVSKLNTILEGFFDYIYRDQALNAYREQALNAYRDEVKKEPNYSSFKPYVN